MYYMCVCASFVAVNILSVKSCWAVNIEIKSQPCRLAIATYIISLHNYDICIIWTASYTII